MFGSEITLQDVQVSAYLLLFYLKTLKIFKKSIVIGVLFNEVKKLTENILSGKFSAWQRHCISKPVAISDLCGN